MLIYLCIALKIMNQIFNADTHEYAHNLTLWIDVHSPTPMSILETLQNDLEINKVTTKVVSLLTGYTTERRAHYLKISLGQYEHPAESMTWIQTGRFD